MLAFLLSPLGRALGVTTLCAFALLAAYLKGRDDAHDKMLVKAAQDAAEWASQVKASEAAAYRRGLQDARSEARNKEIVNDIGEHAAAEPDSDAECLSADTVDRLRQLR